MDNLAKEIEEALMSYSDEVNNAVQEEIVKLSKEIVKDLKSDPIIPERTGEYKRSFYAKKIARGNGYLRVVVANKKYQLTHLLEYGHATKGGTGRTRSYPHWAKAQEKAETLANRIEGVIK